MVSPLIELRNVTKEYDEGGRRRTVLRGASLTVQRGELAVLIGRSGTGKSTLLNLLSGIDPPSSGEVVIDGVSLSALPERERTLFRRDTGSVVFYLFNLIPTLTVEENLLLPMELKGRIGPEQRRAALALLAEVGLADRAGSFPDLLSGGEQQRVAVARALAHDALLVLADEPTGNLDLETGLQVLDLLDRLTRRAGKTMVMVTHSPEVVGLADRVFRIEDCRLVERRERASSGAPDCSISSATPGSSASQWWGSPSGWRWWSRSGSPTPARAGPSRSPPRRSRGGPRTRWAAGPRGFPTMLSGGWSSKAGSKGRRRWSRGG